MHIIFKEETTHTVVLLIAPRTYLMEIKMEMDLATDCSMRLYKKSHHHKHSSKVIVPHKCIYQNTFLTPFSFQNFFKR